RLSSLSDVHSIARRGRRRPRRGESAPLLRGGGFTWPKGQEKARFQCGKRKEVWIASAARCAADAIHTSGRGTGEIRPARLPAKKRLHQFLLDRRGDGGHAILHPQLHENIADVVLDGG